MSFALVERQKSSECVDFLQSIDPIVTQPARNCERARQKKKLYALEKFLVQIEALPGNNHRSIRTTFPALVHTNNLASKKTSVLSYVVIGLRTE